jgi:putative ABC transport system permease protein
VAPRRARPPQSVTILARASRQRAAALPAAVQAQWESRPQCHATLICLTPGQSEQATAAAGVLGLTTVAVLLVWLVAAAGFVVVAHRRLRQLGMLAAVGATERHLRLVLLANGAVVGAIAAVSGTAVAIASWIAAAPALETATGHRIDRFNLPWWLIGAGMLLAVVTATAAAWWPARAVARIPVTLALSARPPRPKPARRSGLAAGLLITASVICLAAGIDAGRDRVNPPLVIVGTVTMVLGILLAGPLAIRAPGGGRYASARRGAVAILVAASAAEHTADEGNLPDRQVLIRVGDAEPLIPERTPAQLRTMEAQVDRIAATLDGATVVALDAAVNPADREGRDGAGVQPPVVAGRQVDENTVRDLGILYVATPGAARPCRDRSGVGEAGHQRRDGAPRRPALRQRLRWRQRTHPERAGGRPPRLHLLADLVHHPRWSAPGRLATEARRLAHRDGPAPDRGAVCGGPRHGGSRRPDH